MIHPVAPAPGRLAGLRDLQLRDGPAEQAFDRLTRMAVALLGVPAAFVALADEDRDILLGRSGFTEPLVDGPEPREDSLCRRVVAMDAPLLVGDVRREPGAPALPIIRALDIIACAAVPLRLPGGAAIGALCVMDTRRRRWSPQAVAVLTEMAASIVAEIELRRARQAAEAERARYHDLIQDLDAIVWEMDLRTARFTFVSQSAETVFGHPVSRWLEDPGLWEREIVHPGDRARVLALCTSATAEGRDHDFDYRAVTADGGVRWMHNRLRVVRGPSGSPALLRGVAVDVTDAREAEERYRLMVEGSEQVFFYEHDREGRFTYLSPSVRDVLGYAQDELVGTPYRDLLTEAGGLDEVERRTRAALESGIRSEPYTARLHDRGGRPVVIEIVERPLVRHGVVTGIQGFARDVTQRSEAERRLRESEEQFRQAQKMEAVGRLAAGVAHDFNNSLTAIRGHVDLVMAEMDAADPRREDMAEVARATERAVGLTRQLLAFSRQQVLRPRVLDLNAVISELEAMLRRVIGEQVRLRTQLDPALSRVEADAIQLQQVLMNLVVNARDAMPAGGRLEITTRDAVLTRAEVERFSYPVRPGDYVLMTVTDTGEGMDEATVGRIFEPFFTTKPSGQGTGLGLSTVYGIIKQSGGYIWARSTPARGTTFSIYLPRASSRPVPGDEPAGEAPELERRPASPRTILVVEDEPSVRHLICKTLRRQGHTVVEAENGRHALERLATAVHGVDLVLTDVVMPDMGGPELGRAVRVRWPGARIVYMSGYTEDELVLDPGGVLRSEIAFLEKPFASSDLLRVVDRALTG